MGLCSPPARQPRTAAPLLPAPHPLLVATSLLLASAVGAAAQHPNRAADLSLVPPDHWVYDVVHRLDAARLGTPGFDPAAGTITIGDAARVLAAAAGRAEALDHPLQLQLLDWLDRLRAEYPDAFTDADRPLAARLLVSLGLTAHQNPLRPRVDTIGPLLAPDTFTALGALRLDAVVAGRLQLQLDGEATHQGLRLREAFGAARLGPAGLWAGRRRTGFPTAAGGGLVVDRTVAWDGAGAWLVRPLRLPLLRRLRLETFLAALGSNGTVPEPWFWATRGVVEPLPHFSIGITRAIMFGDTAGGRALNWDELPKILIGLNSVHARDPAYPDNQLVAVDARWRAPWPATPLALYLTWGADDSSGAWWDSPGIIAGILAPALPGRPDLAIGIEHAVFTGARGHFNFYEHAAFSAGWAEDDRIIGHPLAGGGREWLLHASFDRGLADPALHGRAFRRVRTGGNRLAPVRLGESWGGALDVTWFATPFRLYARATIEAGSGWKTGAAEAGMQWFAFPR